MTAGITKTIAIKANTVLLRFAVKLAWGLISKGGEMFHATARPLGLPRDATLEWLYEWRAGRLLSLHATLVQGGTALEAVTERTAERLGIDILDVLLPLTACGIKHDAA